MNETISVHDLQPGDVLLHKGTAFISRAIQFFDGTDMSHASLYLGNQQVGEAIAEGLVQRDLTTAMHGNEWVKAFRLKDTPGDMAPVLQTAEAYLEQGNRYGYEQLLLLAFLCLTRKLKLTPTLRLLVRTVLDTAAAVLTRLISHHREPMICSEFVYRSYDEAMPGIEDPYSLRIGPFMAGAWPAAGFMAPGTVPQAMPRGEGIHPQSLLAFLSTESSDAWLTGTAGPALVVDSTGQPEVDTAELEETITAYLNETRGKPAAPLAGETVVTLEELRAATDRFAAQLYAAGHDAAGPELSLPSVFTAASPAYQYLIAAAADFVTPADLYRTQSLYPLGQIED